MSSTQNCREFTRDELVAVLRRDGASLLHRFLRLEPSLESLIKHSVGRNTFRAFHKLTRPPSEIFREWSAAQLSLSMLNSLSKNDQSHYDEVLDELAIDLANYWHSEDSKALAFGPSRKLLNLLFKNVVRWTQIPDSDRGRLIDLLHVPLDEYSLAAIRKIAASGEFAPSMIVPPKPRMGLITSREQYYQIQHIMRAIARLAGVPPISIDLVAWNVAHQHF